MVAIISHSAIDGLVKNKDVRSGSVDSFSSTIDVHAHQPAKQPTDNEHDATQEAFQFGLVNEGTRFDVIPPSHRSPTPEELHLREALSSIVILDSASRPEVQVLLDAYSGHLVEVGSQILKGLREAAPSQLAARVGDYNENLFYEMQDRDASIPSIVGEFGEVNGSSTNAALRREVESFDASIRRSLRRNEIQYRGSFMRTERTMYQPAHVDYDYALLRQHGHKLFLAFFPLTEEGAFLQLWQDLTRTNDEEKGPVEGTVVYVPYGKMLVVPSDTIHGGGFKRGEGGNLRFHLYIAVEDDDGREAAGEKSEGKIALLDHPMNRYTEERDRRRELCERFVDANGLEGLLGVFFDA